MDIILGFICTFFDEGNFQVVWPWYSSSFMHSVFTTEELSGTLYSLVCPSSLLQIHMLALAENGAQGVKKAICHRSMLKKNMQ